ncbi:MAG: hypothetical protein IJW63_00940 [Lachnospiraceae bacterium]|nr:hypothetical protein [Lachnospiraceae bacterium]
MEAYIAFGVFVFLLIVVILAKGFYDEQTKWKRFKIKLTKEYGKRPEIEYLPQHLTTIPRYYEKHPKPNQIDDITWNDLDMDEIFFQINKTLSSVGEEYLYYKLRTPEYDVEKLKHFDEICDYFVSEQDQRIKLQLALAKLGKTGKHSIYDYIDHLDILGERKNTKHYLSILLLVAGIGVLFVDVPIGLVWMASVSVYNMISYFKEKNEIDMYIFSFAYVMRLMEVAEQVTQLNVDVCKEEIRVLKEHKNALNAFRRGAFWLMSSGRMSGSGNPLDILTDYMRMIFHLDLIQFNKMLHQVRIHLGDIEVLIENLGYLETAIAIGEYRYYMETEGNGYCKPLLHKCGVIKVEQGYHPLLLNPVKNSIDADRGVLLTGSNASGKSTFLKMVAIEAIMAQTIFTCTADSYEGDLFVICSSMSLKDDIEGGDSYYIVEIKSIKRILDIVKKGEYPVLCFVDEVLRGTNTVERVAASTEILRSLSQNGVLCFAATHDIELTDLLSEQFDNYHFEEKVQDGDVLFNYELMIGKATTRNAIQLLRIMGYDSNIIESATDRAERFLQTGRWMREEG